MTTGTFTRFVTSSSYLGCCKGLHRASTLSPVRRKAAREIEGRSLLSSKRKSVSFNALHAHMNHCNEGSLDDDAHPSLKVKSATRTHQSSLVVFKTHLCVFPSKECACPSLLSDQPQGRPLTAPVLRGKITCWSNPSS